MTCKELRDGRLKEEFEGGREIQKKNDFNPSAWNYSNLVTPPPGIPMQCEYWASDKTVERFCAVFKDDIQGGRWVDGNSVRPVTRFRPWE